MFIMIKGSPITSIEKKFAWRRGRFAVLLKSVQAVSPINTVHTSVFFICHIKIKYLPTLRTRRDYSTANTIW